MTSLATLRLDSLPSKETDEIEYKSASTDEKHLKRKLANAGSAFWNSGGGIFLAGIADDGKVEGGIPSTIGKQSREDWVSQVLSSVRPTGDYKFRIFSPSDHSSIVAERCVLAVQFLPSSAIPHQSPDSKYYIRAGAHTVPASHDIVDALHAKRHFQSPRLVHLAQIRDYASHSDLLYIEVIAATDAVALDVEIDLSVKPAQGRQMFPLVVPIIDRIHSFGFRFEVDRQPPFSSELEVRYCDVRRRSYSYNASIDASKCIPPWNRYSGSADEIIETLSELRRTIHDQGYGLA